MASIYDGYQLANSNLVKPYQGNTLNELMKVSDVMEDRFNASIIGIEQYQGLARTVKARAEDQPLLNQRLKEYDANIKKYADRPDLENVPIEIHKLGRRFAEESQIFAQQAAKEADYQKHLDDLVEKGPGKGGVSRQTALALAARSKERSQLQFDPQSGRYSGGFQGNTIASEVDINDWIKKVAGDVAASKGATIVEKEDGLYFHKEGHSDERVDFETQIRPAIQRAYSLDPEIQSDFVQRAQLTGWKLKGLKAADIKDSTTQKAIQDLMQRGASESDAVQAVVSAQTHKDLVDTLQNYGSKYAYAKHEDSYEYDGLTVSGQQAANKLIDEQPLFLPGSVMQLSAPDKDLGTLKTNIAETKANLETVNNKLANRNNLDTDEIALLERQRRNLEATQMSKEAIISGAEEAIAKRLSNGKYKSRREFLDANGVTKEKEGFRTPDVLLPGAQSGAKPTQNTKNGITPGTNYSKLPTEFDDAVKKEIRDNANKYAIQPTSLVMPKSIRDDLKIGLSSNPSAAQWFKVGENDPTSSLPDDFEIGNIKVLKDNGSVYFDVTELSTKKGENSRPTDKKYTVQLGPGNSAGLKVANWLLQQDSKGNVNANQDALAAASVLIDNNWSGFIGNAKPRAKNPVMTSTGKVIGYVERRPYEADPSRSRYVVYGADGRDASAQIPINIREDIGALSNYIIRKVSAQEQADRDKRYHSTPENQ